jgi:hypothetical protein
VRARPALRAIVFFFFLYSKNMKIRDSSTSAPATTRVCLRVSVCTCPPMDDDDDAWRRVGRYSFCDPAVKA